MGHLSQDQHRTEQRNSQRGIQPGDLLKKVDLSQQIRNQQGKDQRYCRMALPKDNLDTMQRPIPRSIHILFSKSLLIFS